MEMYGMETTLAQIKRLFPEVTDTAEGQLRALGELYAEWNEKINIISRKDIGNLYPHHILHSMGIVSMLHFAPATRILDAGTGGGFPGIPLAIVFPQCHFYLVDSIGKKIKVCRDIAERLELSNVSCLHSRVEDSGVTCHFVVSRAAMPLETLANYTRKLILKESFNPLPNGLIALKGGSLERETAFARRKITVESLSSLFEGTYYEDKKIVYLPLAGTN